MKLDIIGPAYALPSIDANYQRCVNMFPMSTGPAGNGSDLMLVPTAGLSLFADFGNDPVRQMKSFGGFTFVVSGNDVYKLDVNEGAETYTSVLIGTMSSSEGYVGMAANPTQVIFVDGSSTGKIYSYSNIGTVTLGPIGGTASDTYTLTINGISVYLAHDVASALSGSDLATQINTLTDDTKVTASWNSGTGVMTLSTSDSSSITVVESGTGFTAGTDGLTVTAGDFDTPLYALRTITDNDFPASSDVVFLDGYFIVSEINSGRFYFSDLNDGTSWDATNIATAESATDNIVGLGISKGELWVFGTDSVEIWYNAANNTGSPFSPRSGLSLTVGCAAQQSIVSVNDLLVWLDSRGFIVQSAVSPFVRDNNSGYDLQIISTEPITSDILTYTNRSNAIAMVYTEPRGHIMYQISFPTANKTWVFDYSTNAWHERSYYNTSVDQSQYHLGQFYAKSGILHLMAGIRNSKIYIVKSTYYDDNGNDIRRLRVSSHQNAEFDIIGVNRLDLRMETGMAAPTDIEPNVLLRYSNDGGHTWSFEMSRSFGNIGQYNKSISWNRLGSAREWTFEFVITAAVPFSIIRASVEAEVGK